MVKEKEFKKLLDAGEAETYVACCSDCERLFSDGAISYATDYMEVTDALHLEIIHMLFYETLQLIPRDLHERQSIRKELAETKVMPSNANHASWFRAYDKCYNLLSKDGHIAVDSDHYDM